MVEAEDVVFAEDDPVARPQNDRLVDDAPVDVAKSLRSRRQHYDTCSTHPPPTITLLQLYFINSNYAEEFKEEKKKEKKISNYAFQSYNYIFIINQLNSIQ